MKKLKHIFIWCLMVCGAFALAGCGEAKPISIETNGVKTEFKVGDDFSLGVDSSVKVLFDDDSELEYSTSDFTNDAQSKIFSYENVTIDYSEYNNQEVGTYTIYVNFDNSKTQLSIDYTVSVGLMTNAWETAPSITNWTYGQSASVPTAVATYGTVVFEYKLKNADDFSYSTTVPTNAGDYTMRASVAETSSYEGLSQTVEFSIGRKAVAMPTILGTYTYTGQEQTAVIAENEAYTINNNKRTKAGSQDVAVILASNNYKWADGSLAPINLTFTIEKAKIEVPAKIEKTYTGIPQTSGLENNAIYEVIEVPQTVVGDWFVRLTLNDPENYEWIGKQDSSILIEFDILVATNDWVAKPTIDNWNAGEDAKTPVATAKFGTPIFEYKKVGENDSTYTTIVPTVAGDYTLRARVPATANYTQIVGTVDFKIMSVVAIPAITGTYAYTGEEQTANIAENPAYQITNNKRTNAGSQEVKISLVSDDYVWADGTTDDITLIFTIEKQAVAIPTIEDKIYTGNMQTSGLTSNSVYTVIETSDSKINVGNYTVALVLVDFENYKWDSEIYKEQRAEITFKIVQATNSWISEPTIGGWVYGETQNTPTAQATFGEIKYEYSIEGADNWNENIPTDAGTYEFRATVVGNDNYTELTKVVKFTISQALNEITNLLIADWKTDGIPSIPTFALKFGDAKDVIIEFKPVDADDEAYSTEIPNEVGEYIVKVTLKGNSNYTDASATMAFNILVKAPTIPAVNGLSALVGTTLANISLPEGFVWDNEEIAVVEGRAPYFARYSSGASNEEQNVFVTLYITGYKQEDILITEGDFYFDSYWINSSFTYDPYREAIEFNEASIYSYNIENLTVAYSSSAGGEYFSTYTIEEPNAGLYTIYFKLSAEGYVDYYGSFTVEIEKLDLQYSSEHYNCNISSYQSPVGKKLETIIITYTGSEKLEVTWKNPEQLITEGLNSYTAIISGGDNYIPYEFVVNITGIKLYATQITTSSGQVIEISSEYWSDNIYIEKLETVTVNLPALEEGYVYLANIDYEFVLIQNNKFTLTNDQFIYGPQTFIYVVTQEVANAVLAELESNPDSYPNIESVQTINLGIKDATYIEELYLVGTSTPKISLVGSGVVVNEITTALNIVLSEPTYRYSIYLNGTLFNSTTFSSNMFILGENSLCVFVYESGELIRVSEFNFVYNIQGFTNLVECDGCEEINYGLVPNKLYVGTEEAYLYRHPSVADSAELEVLAGTSATGMPLSDRNASIRPTLSGNFSEIGTYAIKISYGGMTFKVPFYYAITTTNEFNVTYIDLENPIMINGYDLRSLGIKVESGNSYSSSSSVSTIGIDMYYNNDLRKCKITILESDDYSSNPIAVQPEITFIGRNMILKFTDAESSNVYYITATHEPSGVPVNTYAQAEVYLLNADLSAKQKIEFEDYSASLTMDISNAIYAYAIAPNSNLEITCQSAVIEDGIIRFTSAGDYVVVIKSTSSDKSTVKTYTINVTIEPVKMFSATPIKAGAKNADIYLGMGNMDGELITSEGLVVDMETFTITGTDTYSRYDLFDVNGNAYESGEKFVKLSFIYNDLMCFGISLDGQTPVDTTKDVLIPVINNSYTFFFLTTMDGENIVGIPVVISIAE